MDYDSLIDRLEKILLPVVEEDLDELVRSGLYSKVKVDSLRHAEKIHALGIGCTPVWATKENDRLTFFATIMGMKRNSGRFDITWSQTFIPSRGTGYTKKEFSGFLSDLDNEESILDFEKEWKRKNELFMKVALKGKPSPYFLRRLKGAPRDVKGVKEEVNQTVDTTPVSAPH
ncbi:hypothetical protein VDG1235_639 [Verrucomicrobiia bacterium DG1235]|nr:hypothetical protein VDG1235_639 [Verrucomicrobiae bacterium DG1235]